MHRFFSSLQLLWVWLGLEGSKITNRLVLRAFPHAAPWLSAVARRHNPSACPSRHSSRFRTRSPLPYVPCRLGLTTPPGRAGMTPDSPIRRRLLCLRLEIPTRVRVAQVQLWLDDISDTLFQYLQLRKPALSLGCQRCPANLHPGPQSSCRRTPSFLLPLRLRDQDPHLPVPLSLRDQYHLSPEPHSPSCPTPAPRPRPGPPTRGTARPSLAR